MAPERITEALFYDRVLHGSEESDIYSLAMTSFTVCTSFGKHPDLIRPSCYDQVLTGVVPYHGTDMMMMVYEVRAGRRPSRPTGSGQSRWLQDPVWDAITSGWHDRPKQRCQLSDMYNTFSLHNQQNSESEIQRQVNEMNEVSSSTSPPQG